MTDPTFCISISTIPSRINNINDVIKSINNQTVKPDQIFLNIPYEYKRFPNEKMSENQLNNIVLDNLEIIRCKDFGPGTKILGAINNIRNYDFVLLLDDDHIYNKNVCEIMLKAFKKEKVNYSFYLNKIFGIKMGQCADVFLIDTKLLDKIETFYEKFVKNNMNMFLDDDLWMAIYLQKVKKTKIKNLMNEFRKISNDKTVYTQNINSKINSLHLTVHKDGFLLNRRKIQKIEYIKYVIKKFFIKI